MGSLIDGKAIAAKVKDEVATDVATFVQQGGAQPCLAVVLVGEDPASAIYVRHKIRSCEKCGIRSIKKELPATATTGDVLAVVDELNADPSVNGILVQMPLPNGCDEDTVIEHVDPLKDVDGFHSSNLGRLAGGVPRFISCTPFGILRLLQESDIRLEGADAVIVGRSRIVGRPMAYLLTNESATVTVCHSRTRDLEGHVRRADIVIAAVGRAEFVRGSWIKPGAAVIDVGINRLPPEPDAKKGKLVGDVHFDEAFEVASAITPVPGGVGPMTVAMLMKNTLFAARLQRGDA
jgi:methylenetetrahydrofolate dehydrogenase (NADP+)/methenyltetrahydrofolate cyclohydrolase